MNRMTAMQPGSSRQSAGPGAATALLLALCLTTITGAACAQCQYEVTIIPDSGPFTNATVNGLGLSEQGHVVGRYHFIMGDDEAFVWTVEDGIQPLPRLDGYGAARAYDVANAGVIVGQMTGPNGGLDMATLWLDGQPIELGVGPGGNWSTAVAVHAGETLRIVGTRGNSTTGDPGLAAFLWEDGEMTDLPLPMEPHSRAYDISATGLVVGWMGPTPSNGAHAYLLDLDSGELTDIGLPSSAGIGADARGVSDRGYVTGMAIVPDPNPLGSAAHAFFWQPGMEHSVDLGTLPGRLYSYGYDCNDARQVVGYCRLGRPDAAFLWQHGVMHKLDDLIPAALDVRIDSAREITNDGRIVGGAVGPIGRCVAVLLTPVQTSIGDATIDCRVDVYDLLEILGQWGPCEPCLADLNGDGTVDALDLMIVLESWS